MEPRDSQRAAPRAGTDESEIERVSRQVRGELEQRGVRVHDQDTPDELADLLTAVERFESAVRARGGDSFTNAPQSSRPDNPEYVVPKRGDDQGAREYIARVRAAADRLGVPPA